MILRVASGLVQFYFCFLNCVSYNYFFIVLLLLKFGLGLKAKIWNYITETELNRININRIEPYIVSTQKKKQEKQPKIDPKYWIPRPSCNDISWPSEKCLSL